MLKDILYEKVEQRLVEKELDPAKSKKLAEWTSAEKPMSLRNDSETLYISEQGAYYIVYEGGLNSGFHNLPGVETWSGGSYIRIISLEEAYSWCEETGNYDAIKDHFPFFLIYAGRKSPREKA